MTAASGPLVLFLDPCGLCSKGAESLPEFAREFAANARLLLRRAGKSGAKVVVLADHPPEIDAVALCAALRERRAARALGILVVFPRDDVDRALAAFGAGADDCLGLPQDPRVLGAHVRAISRHYAPPSPRDSPVLRFGPLRLDPARCLLEVDSARIALTPTEIVILAALFAKPEWIVRRSLLLEKMRGAGGECFSHALDAHVSNLRQKLGPYGRMLVCVKGLGYRLEGPAASPGS